MSKSEKQNESATVVDGNDTLNKTSVVTKDGTEEPVAKKAATKASETRNSSKVPAMAEFGRYPPGEQLARWREWASLFSAVISFAPDWTENQKASYVAIAGGQVLRDIINLFKLTPEGELFGRVKQTCSN